MLETETIAPAKPAVAYRNNPRCSPARLRRLQQAVCAARDVHLWELLSRDRTRRVARARMEGMYLARIFTPASTTAIGQAFGGRDHSTVICATEKIARRAAVDPRYFRFLVYIGARGTR